MMPSAISLDSIAISARDSNLSQAQVKEVEGLMRAYFSEISFMPVYRKSAGDLDKKTSLYDLDKSDFFTKGIDDLVINREARIAIHSAKDLPKVIPDALEVIAITKPLDTRDSLVFRIGEGLKNFSEKLIIGTSSKQREERALYLVPNAEFRSIRGTIEERLLQMENGLYDAVVIAECALLRLKITHYPKLFLPGDSTPMQGSLAILARKEDREMRELFSKIDMRK